MEHLKWTRRRFLGTGLLTTAAGAVTGRTALGLQKPALVTRKLGAGGQFKIGIIGCGSRSRRHITAMNQQEQLEIAALCDIVPEQMEEKKTMIKRGTPRTYTDFEQLVRQEDLDAVAIVLPNYLHRPATVAALESGLHVLCEKPMALNVTDCNAMISAAERAGRALQIGTQRRHSTTFQMAVETIRQAPLGRILYSDINTYRGDWAVKSPDPEVDVRTNWRLFQEKGGGIAFEQGAHTVDLNNWILDSEPVEVCGIMGVNNLALRRRTSKDHAGFMVRYASDAVTNYGGVVYNYGDAMPDRYFGVDGTVSLTASRLDIRFGRAKDIQGSPPTPDPIVRELPERDGTKRQWAYFVQVMQGEAPPFPDGYDGRRAVRIIRGAEIASKEGRTIRCSEVD